MRRETQLVAEFLYYSLTTGTGLQTLGEEYCNILQARGELGAAPTAGQRRVLTLLETLGPYFLEKLAAPAEQEDEAAEWRRYAAALQQQRQGAGAASRPNAFQRRVSRAWRAALADDRVVAVRAFLHAHGATLLRVHLALFYISGVYYQLPKRLAGVRFASAERPGAGFASYRALGYVLLAQLGVTGLLGACARWGLLRSGREAEHQPRHAPLLDAQTGEAVAELDRPSPTGLEAEVPAHRRCPLCLSARKAPTAAPCGHLFCWTCLAEWAAQKPECPLCRADCPTSQLVCVTGTDF